MNIIKPMPNGSTRSLAFLREDIARQCVDHVQMCKENNIELLVYCTFRDEWEQARLYRYNRTLEEIVKKAEQLTNDGFPVLGKILMEVGPQDGSSGAKKTKAGPGESAHQYGLAYDCVPLVGGKAMWGEKTDEEKRTWEIVRQLGIQAGLQPLSWERPHFQLPGFHLVKNRIVFMKSRYDDCIVER